MKYTLTCTQCGKEFQNSWKNVKVCPDCKNYICEICGKPFKRDWPYTQKACSSECSKEIVRRPEVIAKREAARRATMLKRYGVDNANYMTKEQIAQSHTIRSAWFNLKPCKVCGKLFYVNHTTREYCNRKHVIYTKCEVCNDAYTYERVAGMYIRVTCSERCRAELRKQTLT